MNAKITCDVCDDRCRIVPARLGNDIFVKTHLHTSPIVIKMSSAKRRLEINYPSIFTPLFSQFNLLNMLSNLAVNSLGEMVSPCLSGSPCMSFKMPPNFW